MEVTKIGKDARICKHGRTAVQRRTSVQEANELLYKVGGIRAVQERRSMAIAYRENEEPPSPSIQYYQADH